MTLGGFDAQPSAILGQVLSDLTRGLVQRRYEAKRFDQAGSRCHGGRRAAARAWQDLECNEIVYSEVEIYVRTRGARKVGVPARARVVAPRPRPLPFSMADLLPPHVLAALGGLDFVSRRVVSGTFAGIHRATLLGAGREFDRHRAYQQGDESRHLDWRLYARTDRLFVRQFREESNLQAFLLVDDSRSMAFAGADGLSKLRYAQMLAAALAHVMLRSGDAVGLARTGGGGELLMRPRNRRGHLHDLLLALERLSPSARDAAAEAIDRVAAVLPRRGRLVLLTDLLSRDVFDAVVPALGRLRARGDEVVVIRPLTPEEEGRAALVAARYYDPDDGAEEVAAAPAADAGYRARVEAHFARVDEALATRGVECLRLGTDTPVEKGLAAWLTRRASGA